MLLGNLTPGGNLKRILAVEVDAFPAGCFTFGMRQEIAVTIFGRCGAASRLRRQHDRDQSARQLRQISLRHIGNFRPLRASREFPSTPCYDFTTGTCSITR